MLQNIAESLLENNPEKVVQLVEDALTDGYSADSIIKEGLVKGMEKVGDMFSQEEIFIPEVLIAAMGMKKSMEILTPLLTKEDADGRGTVVIGTVAGDIHEIGKNLVAIMFQGAGFNVINLGVDVSAEQFVEAIEQHNAKYVACSSMLTTTMTEITNVISKIEEKGLRDKVKIVAGGAPITENWVQSIGADGYSDDGAGAVNLLKGFEQ